MLNAVGYDSPVSIECEDPGMDRPAGASEALAHVAGSNVHLMTSGTRQAGICSAITSPRRRVLSLLALPFLLPLVAISAASSVALPRER